MFLLLLLLLFIFLFVRFAWNVIRIPSFGPIPNPRKKEGDVTVERKTSSKDSQKEKSDKIIDKDQGEYIDFEDIK